jgi:site-specific DNA-adenine methylase
MKSIATKRLTLVPAPVSKSLISSPIKWAGGKRALLPLLLPRIPDPLRTYCEPFAGGASLFFALASEVLEGKRTMALPSKP